MLLSSSEAHCCPDGTGPLHLRSLYTADEPAGGPPRRQEQGLGGGGSEGGVTCSWREALAGRGGGEERGEAAVRPVPSPAISSWYHCSKSTAGSSSFSIWRGTGTGTGHSRGRTEEG